MRLLAVAVGGALGAVLRWALGDLFPDGAGFPWTTFAINVSGSAVLALLPAIRAVRASPVVTAGIGPGVLGGYTTLSTATEQSRALLASGRTGAAAAYVVGTLAACLVAVTVASRWSATASRAEFEAEGGDE